MKWQNTTVRWMKMEYVKSQKSWLRLVSIHSSPVAFTLPHPCLGLPLPYPLSSPLIFFQGLRKKFGAPAPSRWNGKRNANKSTTGQKQTSPVCSNKWWRGFCKEFPAVRKYRTSAMSIMRANKATTAVRDEHFKGFMAFLDRLLPTVYVYLY